MSDAGLHPDHLALPPSAVRPADDESMDRSHAPTAAPGWIGRLNDAFERRLHAGRLAVTLYRLANGLHRHGIPFLPIIIQTINGMMHGIEIHYKATIGPGLMIAHPRGIVIGQNVRAGRDLKLYSSVVLGVKRTGVTDQPKLGDNVTLYAGAKVLGPCHVGDNAIVAANAVVIDDIPANTCVGGIPARTIAELDPPDDDTPEPAA